MLFDPITPGRKSHHRSQHNDYSQLPFKKPGKVMSDILNERVNRVAMNPGLQSHHRARMNLNKKNRENVAE